MTPFEGLLNDEELAAVLTYVRNAFGNKASPIQPDQIKKIRAAMPEMKSMYNPADLLKEHPFTDN